MDESFIFFASWHDDIADMPDATRLEILEAIVAYATTGELPELSLEAGLLFRAIRRDIDRNRDKRNAFRAKQAANGKRGGRPKKNPILPPETQKTQAFSENPKNLSLLTESQKSLNGNGTGNGDGNGNGDDDDEASPSSSSSSKQSLPPRSVIRDSILRVLNAYPESRRQNGLTMDALAIFERDRLWEREAEVVAAIEAWKSSDDWTKDGGKWIPSFTKFLETEKWRFKPASAPQGEKTAFDTLFSPRLEGETEIEYLRRNGFDVTGAEECV